MDELLVEQEVHLSTIKRALQSFRKRPFGEMTLELVEGRRQHLINAWRNCQRTDVKINLAAQQSDKSLIQYFSQNDFINAEEIYLETLDSFNECISKLKTESPLLTRSTASSGSTSEPSGIAKLPRIDCLNFREIIKNGKTFETCLNPLSRLTPVYLKCKKCNI